MHQNRRPKGSPPSRWQAARAVLRAHLAGGVPNPSPGPLPPLSRGGKRLASGLAALLLLFICVLFKLTGPQTATSTPPAVGTPGGSNTTTAAVSVAAANPADALGVAEGFLATYFSWDARDTEQAYVTRWERSVTAAAVAALTATAPLLVLDQGTDAAAQSPAPTIPLPASSSGTAVALQTSWTISVLPEGGEGASWQSRQVQASVTLRWTAASGWRVSALTWSRANEGAR